MRGTEGEQTRLHVGPAEIFGFKNGIIPLEQVNIQGNDAIVFTLRRAAGLLLYLLK